MNTLLKKEKNNTSTSSLSAGRGSILPLKHKGSQRGFEQNPSYTFPYALREGQTGRSMVEMLGVLAVMGVLSVAGIAGYNSAMNKHRANELLNEASKRAVLVAAQAMMGKTGEISLSEFGNNAVSGVTFSKAEIKDNHIVLTLSGNGLADICTQLKNATGDNTVMKITQDDCSELTFNADMSVGSAAKEPENKCPAGGEYDEATGTCKCADGTGSCCNAGKAVCPEYDSDTDTCDTDYLCCESGKHTWKNGHYTCFENCSEGETEWIRSDGDHHCISCPEGEIPYCDGSSYTDDNYGLNNCIDDPACCDGEVHGTGSKYYEWNCVLD